MKVSVHFLSFFKATLASGPGLAYIIVSRTPWQSLQFRVVFQCGVRYPPHPTPHCLCTDLCKLSLALVFLIQYCDLSDAA